MDKATNVVNEVIRGYMLDKAKELLEPGEELNNIEYLRGISELIANAFPSQTVGGLPEWASQIAAYLCDGTPTIAEMRQALYPTPKN